jgi:hypothetical protein
LADGLCSGVAFVGVEAVNNRLPPDIDALLRVLLILAVLVGLSLPMAIWKLSELLGRLF